MRAELYYQTSSIQATHWWMRSRQELSLELLKRFGVSSACTHVDIGCGPGHDLGLLASLKPSRVVGVDVSPIALRLARQAHPQAELIQANISDPLPFRDEAFDVATIFGVICSEWVKSDIAVLREARRILKPDGLLIITEPAFAALAREMDVLGMVKRRYRLKQFTDMLRGANFEVMLASYMTSFGAPIILGMKALRALAGKKAGDDVDDVPDMRPMHPALNALFYGLARLEARFVKAAIPVPFGPTMICVARRK
jgi:SAM-dependent methyltransferase